MTKREKLQNDYIPPHRKNPESYLGSRGPQLMRCSSCVLHEHPEVKSGERNIHAICEGYSTKSATCAVIKASYFAYIREHKSKNIKWSLLRESATQVAHLKYLDIQLSVFPPVQNGKPSLLLKARADIAKLFNAAHRMVLASGAPHQTNGSMSGDDSEMTFADAISETEDHEHDETPEI